MSLIPDAVVRETVHALQTAEQLGESFVSDVGDEFSKGGAKGIVSAATTVARVFVKRLRSSQARRRFRKRWAQARTESDFEAASRELFCADPKLLAAVTELLARRDYLGAMKGWCQRLTFLEEFIPGSTVDEIYVDPLIKVPPGPGSGKRPDFQRAFKVLHPVFSPSPDYRGNENYVCYAEAGTGKTMMVKHFIGRLCEEILSDAALFDNRRTTLPVFISATEIDTQRPLIEALRTGVERTLGSHLLAPLRPDFFGYHQDAGERRWLVVIDGVDELRNVADRQRLLKAVRDHASRFTAYRFLLTAHDTELTAGALADRFAPLYLQEASERDIRNLIDKYAAALGRVGQPPPAEVVTDVLASTPKAPLYVAMSLIVHAAGVLEDRGVASLYREFIALLLAKRQVDDADRERLLQLMAELAEADGPVVVTESVLLRAQKLGVIRDASPLMLKRSELESRLIASGLLVPRGRGLDFRHSSFRAYFRATRFVANVPTPAADWSVLDPMRSGWAFAEFTLDLWRRGGHDLRALGASLLSYGRAGLTLFSKVAAKDCELPDERRFSTPLVEIAVAKWLRDIEERGTRDFDSGVEHIALLANAHPSAMEMLHEIATDFPTYELGSVKAARLLHSLGRSKAARGALLRFLATQPNELEVRAAEALYDIGFKTEGLAFLMEQSERIARADTRDGLFGAPGVAKALHERGHTGRAVAFLESIAAHPCIDDVVLGGLSGTFREVLGQQAMRAFARGWWERNADLGGDPEENTDQLIEGMFELDLDEIMHSSHPADDDGVSRGKLAEVWSRLPANMDPADRAAEVARNGCLESEVRIEALDFLELHDPERHRLVALELLADRSIQADGKRKIAAGLIGGGHSQEVGDALSRFVAGSGDARVEEALLLAAVGRPKESIQHLGQAALAALTFEGRVASCRALCESGASHIVRACLDRALANPSVPAEVCIGTASELLLTEHAPEVSALLWKLLDDPRQDPLRKLAVCEKLFYAQRVSPEQLHRLQRCARQIARMRTPAFIKSRGYDVLDELTCDGPYHVFDDGWMYEDGEEQEWMDDVACVPAPTMPTASSEAGERLAFVDERGKYALNRAWARELLPVAGSNRVTIRHRLDAAVRLAALEARDEADRVVAGLLKCSNPDSGTELAELRTERSEPLLQGPATGIPIRLTIDFAAFLSGAERPQKALTLCEDALRRADLCIDDGVLIAGRLAQLGYSVQARSCARRFLELALRHSQAKTTPSLAIWNAAILLFKLGEREEANRTLCAIAATTTRPLLERLYACHALSQIEALDQARALFRRIIGERQWSVDERLHLVAYAVVLRLDTLARLLILKIPRAELTSLPHQVTAIGLLDRLGYAKESASLMDQLRKESGAAPRMALLRILRTLKRWREVSSLVEAILSDANISFDDRIEALRELQDSPLRGFAARRAEKLEGAFPARRKQVRIARLFTALGEMDSARQILRAYCGEQMQVGDRLELIDALLEAGCDESAFDEVQLVKNAGIHDVQRAWLVNIESNWSAWGDEQPASHRLAQ